MKKVNKKYQQIQARGKAACGTYPGQNRARTFADKKHKANKYACRGNYDQG